MSRYYYTVAKPPKVMLEREWEALLKASAQYKKHRRDHIIFSLALGTGLREREIAELNVGDVYKENGRAKIYVRLRFFKGKEKQPADKQEIQLSDKLRRKLNEFYKWKETRGEDLSKDAPLFVSRLKKRISTRTMRHTFKVWQERIEVERPYTFHSIRHSAINDFAKREGDWEAARIFARHEDIRTTQVYRHVTSEEMNRMVQRQPC